MNTRLAKGGPYLLGTRFSLADFYLSFWIAYLDRDGVCKRLPSIARLYELVRSRPSATPYLEETERMAEAYADMMKKNPAGVIAKATVRNQRRHRPSNAIPVTPVMEAAPE
jgi:glutathione S-transferase